MLCIHTEIGVKVPFSKTPNPQLHQQSRSILALQIVDKEAANHCEVDQLSGLNDS